MRVRAAWFGLFVVATVPVSAAAQAPSAGEVFKKVIPSVAVIRARGRPPAGTTPALRLRDPKQPPRPYGGHGCGRRSGTTCPAPRLAAATVARAVIASLIAGSIRPFGYSSSLLPVMPNPFI